MISEFSASTAGTDVEYVELSGAPNAGLAEFRLLVLEGDASTAAGTIDAVLAFGSTDAQGFAPASLPSNTIGNGTITLPLVRGFSGSLAQDLDTDDDGVLDLTPWTELLDSVAVNDGGGGDLAYSATVLGVGYGGLPFAPGGASRVAMAAAAGSWVRNDFDLAGIPGFAGTPQPGEAFNAPGAGNRLAVAADGVVTAGDCVVPGAPTPVPEPATLALAALGLGVPGLRRRRAVAAAGS